MDAEFEYKKKMGNFAVNIRREARNKIISQLRDRVSFETMPISKIAEAFYLRPKLYGQYTIIQILQTQYKELIGLSNKLNNMQEEQTVGSNNHVTLTAHVNFWAFLLQQLYKENLKLNEYLQHFFIQLLDSVTYREVSTQKMLQIKMLNALEVALYPPQGSKQLRKRCLKWVRGTEGLILINNSMISQFLSPDQYPNVYEVVKQSLKLQNYEKLCMSAQIIKNIMRNADYDDTYKVYTDQTDLMVFLISGLQKFVDDREVSSQASAVAYLMDSYNSVVFDYARMGVALLAVRLIISKIEGNITKGIQIIKFISEVEDKLAVKFLLEDHELNEAGLWDYILGRGLNQNTTNTQIKREGFCILANIMTNGDYESCSILEGKLKQIGNKDLLYLVGQGLKIQNDQTIIKCCLIIFSILLYYFQNFTCEEEETGSDMREYEMRKSQIRRQFVRNLKLLDIEQYVIELANHKNSELSSEAEKLCRDISYVINEQI